MSKNLNRQVLWRTSAVSLVIAAGVLMSATPASSATYVWLNKSITPDGTTYTETDAARQFSRTGITAQILRADGYTWGTTVSYNGYSNSGNAIATQNGPRGYGVTKATFVYKPGIKPNEKVAVKAWLLDAKLSGTFRSTTLDLLNDEGSDAPPVTDVTAEDLRAGQVDGFTLSAYGETGDGQIWTGISTTGFACIFVAKDEYVSSSCNPEALAQTQGVSLHSVSPDHSLQVVYSPAGGITDADAEATGLTRLSANIAINTGASVEGTLTLNADTTIRGTGLAETVAIPFASVEQ